MPELPEVETVARGLMPLLEGQRVMRLDLRREGLRAPFPSGFARAVEGKTIRAVRRRAKYLIFDLEGGVSVLAHLGMSGRLRTEASAALALQKHDHAAFTLSGGNTLIFNDARRFGVLDFAATEILPEHPLLAGLGIEPLEEAFTASGLRGLLDRRSAPIKSFLMDQRVIVGIGNIYASESLHLAGLHPLLPACEAAPSASALHRAIQRVLKAAIEAGGSTLKDYRQASGLEGNFQHRFQVYDRASQPCALCGSAIARFSLAGRSTYFCPSCQPAPHG